MTGFKAALVLGALLSVSVAVKVKIHPRGLAKKDEGPKRRKGVKASGKGAENVDHPYCNDMPDNVLGALMGLPASVNNPLGCGKVAEGALMCNNNVGTTYDAGPFTNERGFIPQQFESQGYPGWFAYPMRGSEQMVQDLCPDSCNACPTLEDWGTERGAGVRKALANLPTNGEYPAALKAVVNQVATDMHFIQEKYLSSDKGGFMDAGHEGIGHYFAAAFYGNSMGANQVDANTISNFVHMLQAFKDGEGFYHTQSDKIVVAKGRFQKRAWHRIESNYNAYKKAWKVSADRAVEKRVNAIAGLKERVIEAADKRGGVLATDLGDLPTETPVSTFEYKEYYEGNTPVGDNCWGIADLGFDKTYRDAGSTEPLGYGVPGMVVVPAQDGVFGPGEVFPMTYTPDFAGGACGGVCPGFGQPWMMSRPSIMMAYAATGPCGAGGAARRTHHRAVAAPRSLDQIKSKMCSEAEGNFGGACAGCFNYNDKAKTIDWDAHYASGKTGYPDGMCNTSVDEMTCLMSNSDAALQTMWCGAKDPTVSDDVRAATMSGETP